MTEDRAATVATRSDLFRRIHRPQRRREPAVLVAVLVGGFLGGVARYLLDSAFPAPVPHFPWTILGVNLAGAFLLALLLVVALGVWPAHSLLRPLCATGFLGAFTTFSTYVVAVVELAQAGAWATGVTYALASIAGGIATASLGFWLGRAALARTSRGDDPDDDGRES